MRKSLQLHFKNMTHTQAYLLHSLPFSFLHPSSPSLSLPLPPSFSSPSFLHLSFLLLISTSPFPHLFSFFLPSSPPSPLPFFLLSPPPYFTLPSSFLFLPSFLPSPSLLPPFLSPLSFSSPFFPHLSFPALLCLSPTTFHPLFF